MLRTRDGADPHYYIDGFFFWDTVVNGARTGTAIASNARGSIYVVDDSVGGGLTYKVAQSLGPGTLVEVKVIISEAFNAAGQALVLGRNGATALLSTYGTDALIQPGTIGVKETTSLLANNINAFFTGAVPPEFRLTYSSAPTAGVARVLFKLLAA